MQALLLVGAGGAAGAVARYLAGLLAMRWLGAAWPYGTFAANVVGGLLMGVLAGVLAQRGGADPEKWRLFLGVGVLGGFTTFSAFSLEIVLMLQRRSWGQAFTYSLASVVLAVAAVFLGLALARRLAA